MLLKSCGLGRKAGTAFRYVFLLALTSGTAFAQYNSKYDEQNPILTPDGTELYFTVAHHPQNVSGIRDLGDIWYAQLSDGKWSEPSKVKGLINNGGYNAILGFSSDGSEMYLYGHYTSSGAAAGSQGISVSMRTSDGWSLPRNEEVLYFRNTSTLASGYISPDKSVYVFSAESRMSYGNEDLYVSFYEHGKWTEPRNLGPIVNTRNQELSPWLSEDKMTLYFSSTSKSVYGSFDVFSSKRLDDTWANWSVPEDLGPDVNSDGKELYYRAFASGKFLTSTHNSDGYGDIIVLEKKLLNPAPVVSTPVVQEPPKTQLQEITASSGFKVYGKVMDANANRGVQAHIIFHAENSTPTQSTSTGDYWAVIDPKLSYTVRIEATGYIGFYEKLNIPDANSSSLEINFKLQPVAVGAGMSLKNVLFKQSTSFLLPESYDELEMVYDFLKLNSNVEIELSGHTDNAGKASLNLKLSKDRVTRVKNYLVEKGIDARRIKGVGYGESKPIASNKTDEGRRLNRRVEFKIISVK